MDYPTLFASYPKHPKESQAEWYKRLSTLTGKSKNAVKMAWKRWKDRMPQLSASGPVEVPPQEVPVSVQLVKILQRNKKEYLDVGQLADQLDTGPTKIKEALEELKDSGYNIQVKGSSYNLSQDIPAKPPTHISITGMSHESYRFGAVGDNHLGSKYERLDVLNALYDYFQEQGITKVFNTGNWIDGEARFNKHDLKVHGLDNQIDYFLDHYPKREGIQTLLITGDDHEGWYTQREGINVGEYLMHRAAMKGRTDLTFLGHMEHDVIFNAPQGQTVLRVLHPGGGSSYALSYSVQKIVESYQGGEKPQILLVGHYHKAEYSYVRGVHCVQTGCTQDQTPFMRKKKLAAHLGGWVCEFGQDEDGAITRFAQEFIPFYDTKYYERKWKYQWG